MKRKPLCRQNGLHQWDAKVSGTIPGRPRGVVRVTVFEDDRHEAVRSACAEVRRLGLIDCTVNHITMIR